MSETYIRGVQFEYTNEKGMGYSVSIKIKDGKITFNHCGPDIGDSDNVTFDLAVVRKVIAKFDEAEQVLRDSA